MSESTASGCPCGDHTTVERSVTTSGSTIRARWGRCCSPTDTTTVSRMSENSPGRGSAAPTTVARASIVVRPCSTEQTTVREAW
jgi:hypothetical protein